ncbi:hypothetical protein Tco_0611626 [Tanacetum coccineum]
MIGQRVLGSFIIITLKSNSLKEENPCTISALASYFSKEILKGGMSRKHYAFVQEDQAYGRNRLHRIISYKWKGSHFGANQDWSYREVNFFNVLKARSAVNQEKMNGVFSQGDGSIGRDIIEKS